MLRQRRCVEIKEGMGANDLCPSRGKEDMANDAREKDRAAHELFEQARAAFNEGRIEAEKGLIALNGHWQPRLLDDGLAREWQAIERMEAAIELLR